MDPRSVSLPFNEAQFLGANQSIFFKRGDRRITALP